MIKQYFIQAWAQLRQQPLISAVSIAGTALAIFLIMLVVMMQQVKVVPFAPESNRDRFLHVKWMSISNSNWGDGTSNGPMSAQTARECFQSLKTPEAVTIYTIVGLLLSVAFAYVGNTLLFAQEFSQTLNPPEVDASILLHASTFGWALLFCFVLNLMSSGFPAWKASRIGIVNALGGRLH